MNNMKKQKTLNTRFKNKCDNCSEEVYLLADMIAEDGTIISFCEQCLRNSE